MSNVPNWWIASNVLNGYPHIPNIGDYSWAIPYSHSNGWRFDSSILQGYPHIFYREITPPVHLPLVFRVTLNQNFQFISHIHDLQMDVHLRHMQYSEQYSDKINIVLKDKNDVELYSNALYYHTLSVENITEDERGNLIIFHTIPNSVISMFDIGTYDLIVNVSRPRETSTSTIRASFRIHPTPYIDIKSFTPQYVHRPIISDNDNNNNDNDNDNNNNNTVKVDYSIIAAEDIEKYEVRASIGNYEVVSNNIQYFEIPATTVTGAITTSTINLNVTTPIRLFSIAHFVRGSTVIAGNTFTISYSINGVNYPPIGPFIGGFLGGDNPDAFREFRLPSPVVLGVGTNTIQFISSTNAIRLFQTTVRPPAPQFTITGTGNIHRMRMEYTEVIDVGDVGDVGDTQGVTGTSTITFGDTLFPGSHNIIVNGDVQIGGKVYSISSVSTSSSSPLAPFIVHPALIEFGEITQSISQSASATRYVGVGVDNTITIKNIEGAIQGDKITIHLFWESEVVYENDTKHTHETIYRQETIYKHEYILNDTINEYSHTIPAYIFADITEAREHIISFSIERGSFIHMRRLNYTTVPRPSLTNHSISESFFGLPLDSNTAIDSTWRISNGINCTIEGSVHITNIIETEKSLLTIDDILYYISSNGGNDNNNDNDSNNNNDSNYNHNNNQFDIIDITTSFPDISTLAGGLYNIVFEGIVSHDVFGSFPFNITHARAFTIAYKGIPEISRVTLNYLGRYVGAHVDIDVTTRMFNVIDGDRLIYEFRQGTQVLHRYTTDSLIYLADSNTYTIPKSNFAELRPGLFTVAVSVLRDGNIMNTTSIPYETVQPPTLHFVRVIPNELSLPINNPEEISVELFVNGRNIDFIQGTVSLENTIYSADIEIIT